MAAQSCIIMCGIVRSVTSDATWRMESKNIRVFNCIEWPRCGGSVLGKILEVKCTSTVMNHILPKNRLFRFFLADTVDPASTFLTSLAD